MEEAPCRKSSRIRKMTAKAEALDGEAVPRKRSRTGKRTNRSVSRAEGALEETAPPRKRTRTHSSSHSREVLSTFESVDASVSINDLPTTTRIHRPLLNRSFVPSTHLARSQFRPVPVLSHATPEPSTCGRRPARGESGSRLASLVRTICRRGSIG